jgi:hemoglobin
VAGGEDLHGDSRRVPALTACEQKVLSGLCDGRSNKEIACGGGCSPKAVEYHVTNLFRKFGVTSRLELVATVLRGRVRV